MIQRVFSCDLRWYLTMQEWNFVLQMERKKNKGTQKMMTSNSHIFGMAGDCCRNCNVLIVFARHSIFTASCQFNMCHSIFRHSSTHCMVYRPIIYTQSCIYCICSVSYMSNKVVQLYPYGHNTDTCYIFTSNQIFISPAAHSPIIMSGVFFVCFMAWDWESGERANQMSFVS